MIIKVILIIFVYLLIGIAVLEVELWHDRKVDFIERWVKDPTDDVEVTMTVIFWPAIFLMMVAFILFIYLFTGLNHLIKGIRIFFTTIIYLIDAIIDKKREEEDESEVEDGNDKTTVEK